MKNQLSNQFILESTTHATLLSLLKKRQGLWAGEGGQGRLGQPATTLVPSSKNIKLKKIKLVASKLYKYPIPESLNQGLKLVNHMQMCFGQLKRTLSSRIPSRQRVWNFEMQNAHQRMPARMRILLFEIFHNASRLHQCSQKKQGPLGHLFLEHCTTWPFHTNLTHP